jgi:hypothetical protein
LILATLAFTANCAGKDGAAGTAGANGSSGTNGTNASTETTPPSAPGTLSAIAGAAGQINLSWGAATDNTTLQSAITYEVCQSTTTGVCTTFTPTYATLAGATSHSVYGLSASTNYYFRVRAKDMANNTGTATNEGTAKTIVLDTTAPVIVSTSVNNGPVFTSSAVQIRFSETADTTSLVITLNTVTQTGTWSQTTFGNDTFTFTAPAVAGLNNLTISVKDTTGNLMPTKYMGLAVYDAAGTPFLYVATTGNDGNAGTIALPFLTIQAAITAAVSGQAVKVATGTYNLNSNAGAGNPIVLKQGVSLFGGYNTLFTARDFVLYETIVNDTSVAAGAFATPNRAVSSAAGVTNITVVDGLTINGASGSSYNSGIFNAGGGAPTISNCKIKGGGGGGGSSNSGIFNASSSPTISNNTLNGGTGTGTGNGYGIFNDTAANPTITNNSINGGVGNITQGIYNAASAPIINGNTIAAGNGASGSYGIATFGSTPTITNNTINGGTGTNSYGVYNSGVATISNNNIGGGTGSTAYGIYCSGNFAQTINSNTISGSSSVATTTSYGVYSGCIGNLTNNTISGGSAVSNAYGVYTQSYTGQTIANNTIDGGSAASIYGAYDMLSSTIRNNTITAGTGGTNSSGIVLPSGSNSIVTNNVVHGGFGSSSSYGIAIQWPSSSGMSSPTIRNNTINGGGGTWSISILVYTSAPLISNNILFTSGGTNRICYDEAIGGGYPTAFTNNLLFNCPTALYFDNNTTNITNLTTNVTNNTTATLAAWGNISVDPLFVNMATKDYHLQASSPIDVREGGLDLTGAIPTDKDGVARTAVLNGSPANIGAAGMSMGAFEKD